MRDVPEVSPILGTTVKLGTFPTDILERPQNVPKNHVESPTSKLGHTGDIRTFDVLFVRGASTALISPTFSVFSFFAFYQFQSDEISNFVLL